MNYLIIGFDLGDGESLISYQIYNDTTSFIGYFPEYLEMPEQGRVSIPMPTCLCEKRNGDYVFSFNSINSNNFKNGIINFKKQPTSFFKSENITDNDLESNSDFQKMKKEIKAFVNKVFPITVSKLNILEEIDKILICVGHPTKWNDEDIRIYKGILSETVIGKDTFCLDNTEYPSELLFFAESRAAFLYARNEYKSIWDMNQSRLLIDIGSSTIDVTAVSGNDRIYNNGNNFLGARIIDYLIRNLYYKKIKESDGFPIFIDSITENSNLEKLFLFRARQVKESFFNGIRDRSDETITFRDREEKLRIDFSIPELKELIEQSPIRDIIENELKIHVSEEDCDEKSTWINTFEKFLYKQKKELENRNILIKNIILTGSASQMYFIPECCKKIFGENISFAYDTHPGVSIASGLTMAGVAIKLAEKFEQEAIECVSERIGIIIAKQIPDLSLEISERISLYYYYVCFSVLFGWKKNQIVTLNEAKKKILDAISQANINNMLKENDEYKDFISKWYKKIENRILSNLEDLCLRYNINFTLSLSEHVEIKTNLLDENIDIVLSLLIMDFLPDIIINTIPNIIGGIFVFFTYILMGIFAGLGKAVKWILEQLGINIQEPSEFLQEKIMNVNLPLFLREKISERDLADSINNNLSSLKEKIKQDIEKDIYKRQIIRNIEMKIRPEIQKRINEIKYIISGDMDKKKDNLFLMPVDDVFEIRQGIVLTGHIERGIVNMNDDVEIVGIKSTKKAMVIGIEQSGHTVDYGITGDNVGLLLRGINKNDVNRGQVVAKLGTIQAYTKFDGQIYFLTKEEGGRHSSFSSGYLFQFSFRNIYIKGAIEFSDEINVINPGDRVKVMCRLNIPIAMEKYTEFEIIEGDSCIAYGHVDDIIN